MNSPWRVGMAKQDYLARHVSFYLIDQEQRGHGGKRNTSNGYSEKGHWRGNTTSLVEYWLSQHTCPVLTVFLATTAV